MKTKDQILIEAIDAFFSVVSSNYPEVKTGDIAPLQLLNFKNSCEAVLNSWLEDNAPANSADTVKKLTN